MQRDTIDIGQMNNFYSMSQLCMTGLTTHFLWNFPLELLIHGTFGLICCLSITFLTTSLIPILTFTPNLFSLSIFALLLLITSITWVSMSNVWWQIYAGFSIKNLNILYQTHVSNFLLDDLVNSSLFLNEQNVVITGFLLKIYFTGFNK